MYSTKNEREPVIVERFIRSLTIILVGFLGVCRSKIIPSLKLVRIMLET